MEQRGKWAVLETRRVDSHRFFVRVDEKSGLAKDRMDGLLALFLDRAPWTFGLPFAGTLQAIFFVPFLFNAPWRTLPNLVYSIS